MDLATLVRAAQGGDLDAFGQVVERFQGMAKATAYATVGDLHLAEDAAQEAFIEAYLCLSKLREPAAFPGWFRRIVVKRADRLVRGKHHTLLPLETAVAVPSSNPEPSVLAEARELRQLVYATIATLPPTDRLITALFYLAHYRQQEIATIAELPVTTVKKRLYDVRQRLRRQLEHVVQELFEEAHPAHDPQFARAVQFFIAVRTGDVPKVKAYLAADSTLLNSRERWDESYAHQQRISAVGTFTALHRAVYNGDHNLLQFLLEQRADVNAQTNDGQTPLHTAVICNHLEAVSDLLAAHADPNIGTDQGMTPLHWAVLRDRRQIAALLLQAGAEQRPDRNGRTPHDWAKLKGFEDILMLLRKQQLALP